MTSAINEKAIQAITLHHPLLAALSLLLAALSLLLAALSLLLAALSLLLAALSLLLAALSLLPVREQALASSVEVEAVPASR
jgi:hypothetical protein